jgi:hypothetical protein
MMTNIKYFLIIFTTFVIISNFLILITAKPLTPMVLDYLGSDEETFSSFREKYKYLSCKLMTYSKIKLYYESEMIDQFMNQTSDKGSFLDYLQESTLSHCLNTYTESNMVKRK